MKFRKTVCCLFAIAALAGCGSPPPGVAPRVVLIAPPADLPLPPAEAATVPPGPPPPPPPVPASDAAAPPVESAPAAPPAAPLPAIANTEATTFIYFKSDAYKVDERYRPLLAAHARKLKAAPSLHLLIQSYADRRGRSDYNLALSKKRAETVAKLLAEEGASPEQLEIVYHGQRRGGSDAAKRIAAADRRVELVFRTR